MNEITTLFTAIGDFFTKSDWSGMVKWPFWILLFTVAAGGVYCARFGKKTLLNQSISATLSLLVIYLGTAMACAQFPPLRAVAAELPFLNPTDTAVSLINPLPLEPNAAAPLFLRLMILIFLVSTLDSFVASGKTLLSWFFSQCAILAATLIIYAIIIAGIKTIFPMILGRYAVIPVVVIVSVGLVMLCAKFIFTVIVTGGNRYFDAVYKFFTANKGGSLFTVSALSFLLSLLVMALLLLSGLSALTYASVNTTGFAIILALLLAAQYIFGMFYNERKKV